MNKRSGSVISGQLTAAKPSALNDWLGLCTAQLWICMPDTECHAFERMLIAALVHALFLPGAAMKALHKFEAKRRIIELLPTKRVTNFYCLWASLQVIHLPLGGALRADVKTSAALFAQEA